MELSSGDYLVVLARMVLASLLAIPVAWNRERETQIMGLRTYPLVSLASCGYLILASFVVSEDGLGRVLQGLMTGIGFLGAGALISPPDRDGVRGTATASSVWTTGMVGAAVGLRHSELAIGLVALNYLILRLGGRSSSVESEDSKG